MKLCTYSMDNYDELLSLSSTCEKRLKWQHCFVFFSTSKRPSIRIWLTTLIAFYSHASVDHTNSHTSALITRRLSMPRPINGKCEGRHLYQQPSSHPNDPELTFISRAMWNTKMCLPNWKCLDYPNVRVDEARILITTKMKIFWKKCKKSSMIKRFLIYQFQSINQSIIYKIQQSPPQILWQLA